jgi:MoxR-like ATPase
LTGPTDGRRGALPSGVSRSRDLQERLREQDYLADEGLSTAIFLALKLGRPLFLEGEAGVGKTEVAKVLSRILDTPLIRLQCYEGIDVYQAVYEWDYARQLLHIRATEALGTEEDPEHLERDLYNREFLVSRPLLQALEHRGENPPVLLIDEVDRSDDEFEAFLLEILSDFAVTVPELGTIQAAGCGPHFEPDPRGARRLKAPLPLLLHRAPELRAGGRDSQAPCPGGRGEAR